MNPNPKKFTFAELFVGVGAFRLALEKLDGQCVFSSEIDSHAIETYTLNFGAENLHGDIEKKATKSNIPKDLDFLVGGFPCQTFSIGGFQKGFADPRGRLIFDVLDIAYRTNPKVIFLENVKNILSHADGLTFKFIKQLFEGIGYNLFHAVQNPYKHGNIPQTRDRVFFVAFRNDLNITDFEFPKPIPLTKTIKDCLESQVNFKYYYKDDHIHMDKMKSMIVSQDTAYQLRRVYIRENKKNLCPTLTANMGQGGNNVPLILDSVGIRKLTPRECFNLMGFPTDYKLPPNMADCHLYKQSGNSIVVPIIERITEVILDKLNIE